MMRPLLGMDKMKIAIPSIMKTRMRPLQKKALVITVKKMMKMGRAQT